MARPTEEFVSAIVDSARKSGLDGLAITEHDSSRFGYAVKEIVEGALGGAILIIPGREVKHGADHIVELDLPGQVTFRFLAHPWKIPQGDDFYRECVHGVEIANGYWALDEARIKEFAARYDLVLLSNSDAHSLADIGRHYTETSLEALASATHRKQAQLPGHAARPPTARETETNREKRDVRTNQASKRRN